MFFKKCEIQKKSGAKLQEILIQKYLGFVFKYSFEYLANVTPNEFSFKYSYEYLNEYLTNFTHVNVYFIALVFPYV